MTDSIMQKAQVWSSGMWYRAAPSWTLREQDRLYRLCVSRPALKYELARIGIDSDAYLLDYGCGDGSETDFLLRELISLDWRGLLAAHDLQSYAVGTASHKLIDWVSDETVEVSVSSDIPKELFGCIDLLLSSYVLHDVADVEGYIHNAHRFLVKGGTALFFVVHPRFVSHLYQKGATIEHPEFDGLGTNWIAALEYPIVEEGGTFYVPMFHRSRDYYEAILRQHFSNVESIGLSPDEEIFEWEHAMTRLPFSNSAQNVYYPEIVREHSSLLFVCTK